MYSITAPWLYVSLAFLGLLVLWQFFLSRRNVSLPPGPKPFPIIGNILDMPKEKEWETFAKWGERWGDITSASVFGKTLIVVNSAKIASEMLDKKSSIYSDRPVLPMGGELVGYKNILVMLRYGERFRMQRKWLHQIIGSVSNVKQFYPVEEAEVHRFLKRVLAKPDDLSQNVRTLVAAIILRISHGYEIQEENDVFVNLADQTASEFALAVSTGAFLVDLVPILRFVPSWFPGAGFKRKAKAWSQTLSALTDRPLNYVKQEMAAGTAENSFTLNLLELLQDGKISADAGVDIKWAATSLYGGGSDTTFAAIYSFFLAISLNPEAQKRAQSEIDVVIGNDRLPTMADREQLPYVEAVCKEVLRWHSVTPTGFPHRAMVDDIHDGYFIPKGSLIIPNIWHMMHDPNTYTDPMTFNPDRFIPSNGKEAERDPRDVGFGFGRRVCPGRLLADASVFITCALSLAVFDISKFVHDGEVVEPHVEQLNGKISRPTAFKCTFKPRSEKALALIRG